MLAQEKINEVKRLLATGLYSQRKISRLTGVSRVVIYRIQTGKRKDRIERPKEEWEEGWKGRSYERCPTCGAKTLSPCLACIIRNVLTESKPARFSRSPSDSLALNLQEQHQRRYEQVKAWREAQNDPTFTEIPEDWPFRRRPPHYGKTETTTDIEKMSDAEKIKPNNREKFPASSDFLVRKHKPK